MLGDYIYSADMSGAGAAASYNTPRRFEKAAKRFLLLTIVFITGGLLWIFAISPCMVPVKTDVRSFSGLGKDEVLRIAGIEPGAVYISINAANVERRLADYYMVESAKVVKRFPDSLSIYLEPRRAVATVLARVNGKTRPVYFDRYGKAIGMGAGSGAISGLNANIPLVSGVLDDGRQIKPGMQLSSAYLPLFSRIGAISDEDPGIWRAISEIGIAKKNDDMYDLILYPVHDSIKLRMKNDISKDSIYYALLMFDVCRQLGNGVPGEIDVRSGIGVVNAGEVRFD